MCDPISFNLWQHSNVLFGLSQRATVLQMEVKNINSDLFIFNTVQNSKGKTIKVDLSLTFDHAPPQVSLFWIETEELGGTSAFLSAEWKRLKTLQK